ncbi:MAG: emp24/gp25L/p24 family protein [Candidatus Bathyarchaeia archaeon]|jgi:hypothetical protein
MGRKEVILFVSMVLLATFVVPLIGLTSASEVRTTTLVPVADSFVSYDTPKTNVGKELYLRTEYEKQKTVLNATSFTVPPSSLFFSVYLPQNGRITGSFAVTAGGNKDINFAITDSAQTTYYYQLNRATASNFSFVAPYTGNFYLVFDNSFSFFTSKTVSLSDVILTMDSNVISTPIFLLFDLSNIPPEATINTANLSLSFKDSGISLYNIVKSFDCSESNWNEQAITFENAPLSQSFLTESSSLNMSVGISAGSRIYMDIKPDVVRSLSNGKLTEVIAAVDGEFWAGIVEFDSRESENTPKLEISYTYVSASSSLSSSFMIEGQNVAVNVTTNPSQPQGNIRIQYSTDQLKWYDISQVQGGSAYNVWTPSITGQVYVRSVWVVSWNGGSYQTTSSVSSIYVMPISLVVAIPVAIIAVVAAIVGIRYWRKRRVHVKKNTDFQAPQVPPPT